MIFELPAGHGKSYIMLLVAGLMLKKGAIDGVELIYHEQEILDAERPHIAIMNKHYGERVTAITYKDVPNNKITLAHRKLVIVDEVDSALIDRGVSVVGAKGLFLGLTATGLSHSSQPEMDYLSETLNIVNISAGINSKIEKSVIRDTPLQDFFEQCTGMAKLVYVGLKSSIYHTRVKELCARHKLTCRTDVSLIADLRAITANDVLVVTEERLMRGFDYRSADKNGIALMMCYDASTLRGYI